MAYSRNVIAFLAFFLVALALPALSRATQYVVGDDQGWTPGFNYSAWAQGKVFKVGDALVFKYGVGSHNVFKVAGPEFQACQVPSTSVALTSGNDVITLATPGRKWYICGVAGHCQAGQKLFITVLDEPAASLAPASFPPTSGALPPSPSTSSGPTQHIVGDDRGWTLGFNYTAWAQGRTFKVGDTLVFKYPVGGHNVFKVGGSEFQACQVPPATQALTTGNDVITLATPGQKWYICGFGAGAHCQMGQKLVIIVLPTATDTQAPSPLPSIPPAHEAPLSSPSSSMVGPTQHMVGDDKGWTLNFNYTTWAQGRTFIVGDSLVFKYPAGLHNVFKVGGPEFQGCQVPPANLALTTGNDVITLATPGRKWYICGFANGKHCQMGQRLVITVLPTAESQAPSLPPSLPAAWKAPRPSPSRSSGGPTQHIVGDNKGWALNFNYTAWAQGRTFRVGDSLVFKYPVGFHNVFKVGGPEFQACQVPAAALALTSGNDVITLATPGRKWYICGFGNGVHCQMGQKLVITVLPTTESQAPSPHSRRLLHHIEMAPVPSPLPSDSMTPNAA